MLPCNWEAREAKSDNLTEWKCLVCGQLAYSSPSEPPKNCMKELARGYKPAVPKSKRSPLPPPNVLSEGIDQQRDSHGLRTSETRFTHNKVTVGRRWALLIITAVVALFILSIV